MSSAMVSATFPTKGSCGEATSGAFLPATVTSLIVQSTPRTHTADLRSSRSSAPGIGLLQAKIGSEQREESQQPRADEADARHDIGSPVHSQLDSRDRHCAHCQRGHHPREDSVRRPWGGGHHQEGRGREDQECDGGVTRGPGPTVRRDEPEILRWTDTLHDVLGQRHAAGLSNPGDDSEKKGNRRETTADRKNYQQNPGQHERDPRTQPGQGLHNRVDRRRSVGDHDGRHVVVE